MAQQSQDLEATQSQPADPAAAGPAAGVTLPTMPILLPIQLESETEEERHRRISAKRLRVLERMVRDGALGLANPGLAGREHLAPDPFNTRMPKRQWEAQMCYWRHLCKNVAPVTPGLGPPPGLGPEVSEPAGPGASGHGAGASGSADPVTSGPSSTPGGPADPAPSGPRRLRLHPVGDLIFGALA